MGKTSNYNVWKFADKAKYDACTFDGTETEVGSKPGVEVTSVTGAVGYYGDKTNCKTKGQKITISSTSVSSFQWDTPPASVLLAAGDLGLGLGFLAGRLNIQYAASSGAACK